MDYEKTLLWEQAQRLKKNGSEQLLEGSTPVLWYGSPGQGQLVTIGTNPSKREFTAPDGTFLPREKQKFASVTDAVDEAFSYMETYFTGGRASTRWFGRPGGGKLEAMVEALGYSFYDGTAVHLDYFPHATVRPMGQLRAPVFDENEVTKLLLARLSFVQPERIVVLGSEHCRRLAEAAGWEEAVHVPAYPSIRVQKGEIGGVPAAGLHAKPSEQMIGLGSGRDAFGIHHGSYSRRDALLQIGEFVEKEGFSGRG
ncbi:hypothetical protein [Alkalicoccus urumqiensis]|uniref:Uracil-DNA glycosylase-like domain-containing protein n=1 Tax=Alkalicoccus urumqiensis TaxID=1548213 RepID=A0A2P6MJV2_ALKUR|nr:hypothetical protein [Alkalicoccus urumqiensis]PRO66551.1 hypothetical protein C6I21_04195 [Alkalicoccus urumqiensis]